MHYGTLLNSFAVMSQAEAIRRYSRDRPLHDETVLQHVGWVCLWCVVSGELLQQATDIKIDFGRLLRRAACHDLDELGTGDVARVTKYANPRMVAAFKEIERTSVVSLFQSLGLPPIMVGTWELAKDPRRVEGLLLRYADMAAVVHKVWDEIAGRGNMGFARVAFEIREHLGTMPPGNYGKTHAWFAQLHNSLWTVANDACMRIDVDVQTLEGSNATDVQPSAPRNECDPAARGPVAANTDGGMAHEPPTGHRS